MAQEILVAGATGRTGKIIVNKLIEQGEIPRVLVRDLDAAHMMWKDRVVYFQGDVREVQTLALAMHGVSGIISAIGAQSPVGKNCPKRVGYEGVQNLVQAASSVGVKRFVLISSIAVTRPDHPINCFGRVLEWKLKGEEALRQSGLEYVIIRPGGLKDTPGMQSQLILDQGDQLLGMINRTDLAEICLYALKYPHPLRMTFEVVEAEKNVEKSWRQQFAALTIN